jgi:16S rRNA (cytosine967-C5)-methyltransferase
MPRKNVDLSREHALKALRRAETSLSFPKFVIDGLAERDLLTGPQKAFTYQLVMGTLRNRGTLDWMLQGLCNTPIDRLTPWIRNILRMGLFQILYLDRVPKAAAVDESVKLAKKYGHSGTAGLVNAVLRNAKRERLLDSVEVLDETNPHNIAVKYSHPEWLVELLIDDWGRAKAVEIARNNNDIPPLTARTNTLRVTRQKLIQQLESDGIAARALPQTGEALELHSVPSPSSIEAHKCGLLYFQDASSMLAVHCLDVEPGLTVLDVCAGPGGKATHCAALMKNFGVVHALDVHDHRIKLMEDNAERLGVSIIRTRKQDASERLAGRYGGMDRVLVDAPCSGVGVVRRRIDLKWRLKPSQIEELARLQSIILSNAAECVRSGGILLYCTCTVVQRENLEVVQSFLNNHPDFAVDSEVPPQVRNYTTENGLVQIMPGNENMDGFFIARFRRF